MATAGEMIKVVARAIARPQATVTSYYSVLRKAGMISTTGRGRSAQDLSPRDVARLIIVMLSADNLQEGAAITELMGELVHELLDENYDSHGSISFEDAIAHIITSQADIRHGRPPTVHPLIELHDVSEIRISATPTHLEARIDLGKISIPFFDRSYNDVAVTHPDQWNEIPIVDQLFLRAMMEGMMITRTIDGTSIKTIASSMP